MMTQFAGKDETFRKMMNAITGGSVWIAVILTAAYMLHQSSKMKEEVRSCEQIGK